VRRTAVRIRNAVPLAGLVAGLAACGGATTGIEPADVPSELAGDGGGEVDRGGEADAGPASPYLPCSDEEPCPADAGCVDGMCLPRCHAGDACALGEVCRREGCSGDCDEAHPCSPPYSCVDGACTEDPCSHEEFWPLSVASTAYPLIVHFRDEAERPVAAETIGYFDHSWRVETEELGFDPPLPDGGACGPDERFDVFVWRGYAGGSTEVVVPDPDTPWDDWSIYMIIDPWGPYGGDVLDSTSAHELNHAMQAVHDWHESNVFFEMTAQFIEDEVYDDDNAWREYLFDYQAHPDWAFDYDDDWESYYFYGAALYFLYLRDGPLDGDGSFAAELWRRCRNPPGENEPDFEDALDSFLRERLGTTFLESLVEFSRWRWYTSARDDGRHFEEGAAMPEDALVRVQRRVPARSAVIRESRGPMLLGVHYVTVYREGSAPAALEVTFAGDPAVGWSVQAVPGVEPGTDGEVLDVASGPATLRFGDLAERTLVILALPLGPDDPDDRTDDRFGYVITLEE
jgi:hypothetical protein